VRKRQRSPVRLFLGGPPGAGKTFTGEALAERFGWTHFDCERLHVNADTEKFAVFLKDPLVFVPKQPKVVVSWGFIPEFVSTFLTFMDAGFQPVWLSGDSELLADSLRRRVLIDPSSVIEPNGSPINPEVDVKLVIDSWYEVDVFDKDGQRIDVAALLNQRFS
jgi:hypothetical protein